MNGGKINLLYLKNVVTEIYKIVIFLFLQKIQFYNFLFFILI